MYPVLKNIYTRLTLCLLSILPLVAGAQLGPDCNPGTPNFPGCAENGGGLKYSLQSPLAPGIGSIEALLTTILNVLLVLAVPIIIFFIIFAGFTYVTAQGNPEKIKTATRSLTYAIIGAVLILGGVALSEIIAGVVNSFRT